MLINGMEGPEVSIPFPQRGILCADCTWAGPRADIEYLFICPACLRFNARFPSKI